ncbi:MAG: PspA/IM30 family protein [Planctomycetes bacterium]|nr:PspA/IM30 family protein [Planctomycetota bacterium]
MGLFTRLHRVTVGRIEAFLSRVEDPELVFPVLVNEMEEQLKAAAEAEAKASATLKHSEREVQKHKETIDKYGNGAYLAIREGDEETARQSLDAQIQAEQASDFSQRNLEIAQRSLERATLSRKRIQQQLGELRTKKDEILTRARVAKVQKKIQSTVSGTVGSSDSILDAVARLEAQIEEAEAGLEIQANFTGEGTASASLEKRLEELSNEAEIDRRLAELKQKAGEGEGLGQ